MKSDLFIRTDGSTEIGLGHLVRCISLSSILSGLFNITFVCRKIPPQMEPELANHGISLIKIDQEQEFFNLLTKHATVVVDGYSFDTVYQKKIKQKGSVLVSVDDLHNMEFYSDLIINHAPGINEDDYSAQKYTRYALGLDYALLRPPFFEAALNTQLPDKKNLDIIVICFGGSDSKNLTSQVLKVVSDFTQKKKIIIITGSAYRFETQLLKQINSYQNIEYHHSLSGEEMATIFMKSGVAIVPSSGILFEALATGNVVISGMYTNNQKEVYSGFKKLNAIIDAGEFSRQEISGAIQQIGSFRNQQKFIDGKSPERIRNLFKMIRRD